MSSCGSGIRKDKELIELAIVVVVEGVSASTAIKDVLSKAAIKDVSPVNQISSPRMRQLSELLLVSSS